MNQFEQIPDPVNEKLLLISTALVVVALLLVQSITTQDEKQMRLHQSAVATELKRCGVQP